MPRVFSPGVQGHIQERGRERGLFVTLHLTLGGKVDICDRDHFFALHLILRGKRT